jgi:3-methyladenine DNA glycosylase AlkC
LPRRALELNTDRAMRLANAPSRIKDSAMATDNPNAFKHWFNRDLAKRLASDLTRVHADFEAARFVRLALKDLETLELKARVATFSAALRVCLPQDLPRALALIVSALPPELGPARDGFAGSAAMWPYAHFVEVYGLTHCDESLAALYEITKRSTAEFAIRPFIASDPKLVLKVLKTWVHDPNEHVRRLVSEGTRPRLPWGMRLKAFLANPAPIFALLSKLRDDPSEYVRRSVANHLNDMLKEDEAATLRLLASWHQKPKEHTRWILERALRSLVKAGHPEAFRMLGQHADDVAIEELAVSPQRVRLGEPCTLRFAVHNRARTKANVIVDFAIHFARAGERTGRKVFKLRDLVLAPHQSIRLQKNLPLRPVTTRKHYAGQHALDVMLNGQVAASTQFYLAL